MSHGHSWDVCNWSCRQLMPCMQNSKEEEVFVSEDDSMLVLSLEFVCELLWTQLVVSRVCRRECLCVFVHVCTPFLCVIWASLFFFGTSKRVAGRTITECVWCVPGTVIDGDTLYGARQQERVHTDVMCDQFRIPLSIKLHSVVHNLRLECQLLHSVHLLCEGS